MGGVFEDETRFWSWVITRGGGVGERTTVSIKVGMLGISRPKVGFWSWAYNREEVEDRTGEEAKVGDIVEQEVWFWSLVTGEEGVWNRT